MSDNVGNSHGSSAGRTTEHVTNGGAQLSSDSTSTISNTGGHPAVPASNGATQVNGVASTAVPTANGSAQVKAVNGGTSNTNGVNSRHGSALSGSATWFRPDNVPAPITFLNHGSSADDASGGVVAPVASSSATPKLDKGKGKAKAIAVQQPIGTRGDNYIPTRPHVSFTTDVGPNSNVPGGHYLKIEKITGREVHDFMKMMNKAFNWESKVTGSYCPAPIDTSKKTTLYLRFDDMRDAEAAFEQIETVDPTYHLTYISQSEWADGLRDSQYGTPASTHFFDGQVLYTCEFKQMAIDFHEQKAHLEARVRELAEEAGEVVVFDYYEGEGGKMVFRVEYFKISAAKAIVEHVTPKAIGGWTITTREMLPLESQRKTTPPINQYQLVTSNGAVITPQNGSQGIITQRNGVYRDILTEYISPTGRTAWGVDIHGNTIRLPPPNPVARVKGPACGPQYAAEQSRAYSEPTPVIHTDYDGSYTEQDVRSVSLSAPASHYGATDDFFGMAPSSRKPKKQFTPDGPNKIYPYKIINGIDVRTSVMVRNLPNDMTYAEMKRILDHTSLGRYDFSYLRIDFNNNKNVGYGFVNFVSAEDILPFYEEYFGKPWLPKVPFSKKWGPRMADLSYATIQGLDCLIDKMRNSSVMDENPDSRPKMWWTSENAVSDDMVGQERPFPAVNNFSKKQRSRANASQIGLYTHGSRQARANRSHGHQSHFDRGTMAQIQEEAFFNQMAPNQMVPYHGPYYNNQTSYGYAGHNAMNMVPPPQFSYFSHHQRYYSMGGNGMAPSPLGQYMQSADPFGGNSAQGNNTVPHNNAHGNGYAYQHTRHATQYGPMNEVIDMPAGGQGVVYPTGQEPQEMPAIPEEAEQHALADADGDQAEDSQHSTMYGQNGFPDTTSGGYHPQ